MRYVLLIAILFVGCAEDSSSRQERRQRRDRGESPVVKPVQIDSASMTFAQIAELRLRVAGFRELATQCRNGSIKTMYDAVKVNVTNDKALRIAFDEALKLRMSKEFNSTMDKDSNLPPNADKVFDALADEIDGAIAK